MIENEKFQQVKIKAFILKNFFQLSSARTDDVCPRTGGQRFPGMVTQCMEPETIFPGTRVSGQVGNFQKVTHLSDRFFDLNQMSNLKKFQTSKDCNLPSTGEIPHKTTCLLRCSKGFRAMSPMGVTRNVAQTR